MNKIVKANVAENRYREFEIINQLPEVGDVENGQFKVLEISEVQLDCEQGNDEVYRYKYYEIVRQEIDEEEEYDIIYVAVPRPVAYLTNNDKLENLDTVLIGNGGNSRLDIMLDLSTGEIWSDEFYSHEQGSYKTYHDKNIICVGQATNSKMEDEDGEEIEGCEWNITIWGQKEDNFRQLEEIYITGDYYNNSYDVEDVLDAIIQLYGELE